jgi:hypothetical protein
MGLLGLPKRAEVVSAIDPSLSIAKPLRKLREQEQAYVVKSIVPFLKWLFQQLNRAHISSARFGPDSPDLHCLHS